MWAAAMTSSPSVRARPEPGMHHGPGGPRSAAARVACSHCALTDEADRGSPQDFFRHAVKIAGLLSEKINQSRLKCCGVYQPVG